MLLRTSITSALVLMLVPIALQTAQAQTETVLYNFTYGTDGGFPEGSLIPDGSGDLYGTTKEGGTYGYGTVFKVSPGGCNGWCETVLHSFCYVCTDGNFPTSNLLFDSAGNLYGTTTGGGAYGAGTVFELTPGGCSGGWCETLIYNFCSLQNCADGVGPGGVVWDSSGNLYGTVSNGVFELSPNGNGGWTEQLIYSTQSSLVISPGLAFDATGNLYGFGNNFVFKLSFVNGTWIANIIQSFDGTTPCGAPVVDSLNNVYGTTYSGGSQGYGTVWKLTPVTGGKGAGTYKQSILHTFTVEKTGLYPVAGLTLDSSGNLYGTTSEGGKDGNYGTIFELGLSGTSYKFKILWNFNNKDGQEPLASVILDSSGHLYGTTEYGGPEFNAGTVFAFSPSSIATTTTLTSSPNPSTSGETVTFTATVTSSAGAPPDGETVSFMEGSTQLGTGTLSGGSASFATSSLPVGTSKVDAVYAGDIDFSGSTSKPVKQVVKQ